MKKIFLFLAMSVLISIFAGSCNKRQTNSEDTPTKHTMALERIKEIRKKAADYKLHNSKSSHKTTITYHQTKTVVKDMGGAISGLKWGFRIGAWLGNPVVGAGVGALVGGIAGSCGYVKNAGGPDPVGQPSPNWALSYTNPSTQVGYLHDQGCIYILNNYPNLPTNLSDFTDSAYSIICEFAADSYNINVDTLKDSISINEMKNYVVNFDPEASVEANMIVISQIVDDEVVCDYFEDCITDILNCDPEDYSNMYDFLDAYIDAVLTDTSLNGDQIKSLVNTFNVGRYSLALWSSN